MPVTISLSTVPGRLTRERNCVTKTIELFGDSLGTETVSVSSVADIRGAVGRFGAAVRATHPDASFYVSVRLAEGSRKPRGYDAASGSNGFGQDDFLHIEDGRSVSKPPAGVGQPIAAAQA